MKLIILTVDGKVVDRSSTSAEYGLAMVTA